MDKEYLEDYEQKENEELDALLTRIVDGTFSFKTDIYPPKERFYNIQNPVAMTTFDASKMGKFWAQVPFSGSLILPLAPLMKHEYEKNILPISKIPELIEFIKETGKIQIVLTFNPTDYEGLDHLDPFFEELKPPLITNAPTEIIGSKKEKRDILLIFDDLTKVRFRSWLNHLVTVLGKKPNAKASEFERLFHRTANTYYFLKVQNYTKVLTEELEYLLVENPKSAWNLLGVCKMFIENPFMGLIGDLTNYSKDNIMHADLLPLAYKPKEIRFPFEIGSFLMKKIAKGILTITDWT